MVSYSVMLSVGDLLHDPVGNFYIFESHLLGMFTVVNSLFPQHTSYVRGPVCCGAEGGPEECVFTVSRVTEDGHCSCISKLNSPQADSISVSSTVE